VYGKPISHVHRIYSLSFFLQLLLKVKLVDDIKGGCQRDEDRGNLCGIGALPIASCLKKQNYIHSYSQDN
jgi:hypothetical protein